MILPSLPTTRRGLLAAAAGALVLAACSPAGDGDPLRLSRGGDADGAVFLTQSEIPDAWMDALYEGDVLRDGAGCLRTRTADRHTVIWPAGFRLVEAGGELHVLDREGREVGRIGGPFRLGGGEVASLHDGLPLSDEVREEAEARCPGRYWLVGEVPTG